MRKKNGIGASCDDDLNFISNRNGKSKESRQIYLLPRVDVCDVHQRVVLWQDNRLHLVADLHVEATQIDEELVDDELLEVLDFEDRRAVEILWSEEIQNAVVGLHALEGSVRTEEIKNCANEEKSFSSRNLSTYSFSA
jgi:hypothetical protein